MNNLIMLQLKVFRGKKKLNKNEIMGQQIAFAPYVQNASIHSISFHLLQAKDEMCIYI